MGAQGNLCSENPGGFSDVTPYFELIAFVDGVEAARKVAPPDARTWYLEGRYVCGGTIPNAFCNLETDRDFTEGPPEFSVGLTFEEIFGEPPSEGSTNFTNVYAHARLVPEPSTALLLSFVLMALAAGRRRRA